MNAAQAKILKQFFNQFAELAIETLTAFVEAGTEEKQVSIATSTAQTAKPEKRFLNKKELAELFGVSVRKISDLQAQGLPIMSRFGRRIIFDREDVLIWAKDKEIKGRGKTKLRAVS